MCATIRGYWNKLDVFNYLHGGKFLHLVLLSTFIAMGISEDTLALSQKMKKGF